LPDQIVIPVASGSQLTKIDKGFRELINWAGRGQAVRDLRRPGNRLLAGGAGVPGRPGLRGTRKARTPSPSRLAIGNPADGPYVLDVVRRTGGSVADVDDDTLAASIQRLARTEGIFAETAGGVVIGVTAKLLSDGVLDPKQRLS
jgi:threonine synthase